MKTIDVKRTLQTAHPTNEAVQNLEDVCWTIDNLCSNERLVVESDYSSILPSTFGALGAKTIQVNPTFDTGTYTFELPYTLRIETVDDEGDVESSEDITPPGPYLVIDTSGPPTPPGGGGGGSNCMDPVYCPESEAV